MAVISDFRIMCFAQCRQLMSLQFWLSLMLLFVLAREVQAHPAPVTAVLIDVGSSAVTLEMQIPLSELQVAAPDIVSDSYRVKADLLEHYLRQHVRLSSDNKGRFFDSWMGVVSYRQIDKVPYAQVRQVFVLPTGEEVSTLLIHSGLIIHEMVTHDIYLSLRSDFRNAMIFEEPVALGVIRLGHETLVLQREPGSLWVGVFSMADEGLHHILEGVDHWLFLICLLLPVPLIARNAKKGKATSVFWLLPLLKIITAFTLGHATTLALSTLHWVEAPAAPVEALVALSIIFAAVQLWWPQLRRGGIWIAFGFGLVHGLAFSENLSQLGFGLQETLLALLGFNLGIEAVQLLIVVAVMPWLLLLAVTGFYKSIASLFAAGCVLIAMGWLVERSTGMADPLQFMSVMLSKHGQWLYWGLVVISVGFYVFTRLCSLWVRKPVTESVVTHR